MSADARAQCGRCVWRCSSRARATARRCWRWRTSAGWGWPSAASRWSRWAGSPTSRATSPSSARRSRAAPHRAVRRGGGAVRPRRPRAGGAGAGARSRGAGRARLPLLRARPGGRADPGARGGRGCWRWSRRSGDLATSGCSSSSRPSASRRTEDQLHRFLGSGSGRKIRYGRLLVEALDDARGAGAAGPRCSPTRSRDRAPRCDDPAVMLRDRSPSRLSRPCSPLPPPSARATALVDQADPTGDVNIFDGGGTKPTTGQRKTIDLERFTVTRTGDGVRLSFRIARIVAGRDLRPGRRGAASEDRPRRLHPRRAGQPAAQERHRLPGRHALPHRRPTSAAHRHRPRRRAEQVRADRARACCGVSTYTQEKNGSGPGLLRGHHAGEGARTL